MKLSTYAIICSILAVVFGLAFVFIPVKLMAFYGITMGVSSIPVARYLGMSSLFIGMIFWSYSSVSPTAKSWPKLLLYGLIYDILQLAVTLKTLLSGQGNSMGWTTVALFALLAIGSGYFMAQCNKARAQLV